MTDQDKEKDAPAEGAQPTPEVSPAAPEKAAAAAEEKKPEPPPKPPWEVDPTSPQWEEAGGELVDALRAVHGDAVESARTFAGDLVLGIRTDAIAEVCRTIKNELGYAYIVDVCGVDFPDREQRFEVVYHLYNLETKHRLRLKVSVGEDGEVPTVSDIWVGANWPEREAWDMYGIRFAGHPDLTRILTWEGFEGHPLRKDFPIEGIETGAAIYPEYYSESQGPIGGDGTGWKVPTPPVPPSETTPEAGGADEDGAAGSSSVDSGESS